MGMGSIPRISIPGIMSKFVFKASQIVTLRWVIIYIYILFVFKASRFPWVAAYLTVVTLNQHVTVLLSKQTLADKIRFFTSRSELTTVAKSQ